VKAGGKNNDPRFQEPLERASEGTAPVDAGKGNVAAGSKFIESHTSGARRLTGARGRTPA